MTERELKEDHKFLVKDVGETETDYKILEKKKKLKD